MLHPPIACSMAVTVPFKIFLACEHFGSRKTRLALDADEALFEVYYYMEMSVNVHTQNFFMLAICNHRKEVKVADLDAF